MTATTPPGAPPPVDAAHDPHLSGAFEPVIDEIDAGDLEVTGELPPEMDGMYLRNGPNPRFTPLGSSVYPLEGDGMVHGLRVSDGRARYANRFVRTPALEAEEAAGRALWGGLMTGYAPDADEVGPSLAGTFKDMPDINVVRHGGKLLALGESATPFRLTPSSRRAGARPSTAPGGMSPDTGPVVGGIARAEIDPVAGTMSRRFLTDPASMEFPRVDDRRIGRPHGVVALGTTTGRQRLVAGDHDAVLWLDTDTGRTVRWDAPELAVGEPCFVPLPGDDDGAHGWWVTFALDRADRSSCFLVFSAADPAAGPVATVHIPVRVPLGLHGAWLPTEE